MPLNDILFVSICVVGAIWVLRNIQIAARQIETVIKQTEYTRHIRRLKLMAPQARTAPRRSRREPLGNSRYRKYRK